LDQKRYRMIPPALTDRYRFALNQFSSVDPVGRQQKFILSVSNLQLAGISA